MSESVPSSNRGLWIGLALGGPVVLYGLWGVVDQADRTHPAELARWIIGLAIVHDLVVAPVVLAVGWTLNRFVPGRVWPIVRWAVITTVVLVAVAWPFVRRYGATAAVPSLFPRDYAAGLAVYVAGVWLVAVGLCALVVCGSGRWVGKHVPPPPRRSITMAGQFDEAKGRAKEAVGDLTDNKDLKAEGKTDRAAGTVKDAVESVKDKVNDAIDKVRDKSN